MAGGDAMMKLAATAIVTLAFAGPALAADIPYKAPPPPLPKCANFKGFYVGGHGGWTYYKNEWKDLDNYGFNFTFQDHVGSGSLSEGRGYGGVQGGSTLQAGCSLFGLQADWRWSKTEASASYNDFPVPPSGTLQATSTAKWYGTVRTRAGVVVDNLLLYVTGGLAYAKFERNFLYIAPTPGAAGNSQTFSSDKVLWGFVAGAGTEWNIGAGWSLASEFLYMGFQKDLQNYTCSTPGGFAVGTCLTAPALGTHSFRYEFSDMLFVTRIGVNYRF